MTIMARLKGTKNKKTFQAEELAKELGVDPLEILLLTAKGDWKALGYDSSVIICEKEEGNGRGQFMKYTISPELRAQCAKDACKYLYSQKQAMQVSGTVGIKFVFEDYAKKE